METHLKSKAESVKRVIEMMSVIDEERDVIGVLFLSKLTEKQYGELRRSGLKLPYMKELV